VLVSFHEGEGKDYNREALNSGKIRLISILLPKRSPWLNPLEPIIGQAKRRVLGNRCFINVEEMEENLNEHFEARNHRYAKEELKLAITYVL
jgi:transposase